MKRASEARSLSEPRTLRLTIASIRHVQCHELCVSYSSLLATISGAIAALRPILPLKRTGAGKTLAALMRLPSVSSVFRDASDEPVVA